MKPSRLSSCAALALAAALLVPSLATAGGRRATLGGELVSVSTAGRSVTLLGADGLQKTLRVVASSALVRNGAAVGLANLALRDRVVAEVELGSAAVVRLKAQGPAIASVRGRLRAIDPATGRIDLVTSNGAKSFLVADSTLIVRNGRAAGTDDLTLRDSLVVHVRRQATAGPAPAHDVVADGPDADEVEGTISAIADPDVTIQPRNGAPVVVHVVATTRIEIHRPDDRTRAAIGDLAVGMRAEAHYDPATGDALRIEARAASGGARRNVVGEVSAVDVDAKTLTIAPRGGNPVVLAVDANTRISLDEAPATLADISVGARAAARYDATTLVALAIVAESEHPQPERQVEGRVTATSATGLTITPEHRGAVDLIVDAQTRIRVNGHTATLADVPVGARAHAHYDGATLVASRIDAVVVPSTRGVAGRVTAVSATGLSIAPEHGSAVDLTVNAQTTIRVNGRTATLADVPVGARAAAVYDPATLVASRIEAAVQPSGGLREVEGAITAASPTSITIAPEHNGAPVTLAIDATTTIVRDGRPATAADLRVGDEAEARYDAATLLAKSVRAHHED